MLKFFRTSPGQQRWQKYLGLGPRAVLKSMTRRSEWTLSVLPGSEAAERMKTRLRFALCALMGILMLRSISPCWGCTRKAVSTTDARPSKEFLGQA